MIAFWILSDYLICKIWLKNTVQVKKKFSKTYIAISSSQNAPTYFDHTYLVIFVTFWNSSGNLFLSVFSCAGVVALTPRRDSRHVPFVAILTAERARSCMGLVMWILWIRTHCNVFTSLPSHWMAPENSIYCIFDNTL